MELKYKSIRPLPNKYQPFNRTAYGIEIQKRIFIIVDFSAFNRTAYGIEIKSRHKVFRLP